MTRTELETALGWARAEGWNPGLDDAEAFFAADPDGFLMSFVDGEPAACISAVRYGGAFGFVGFYICRPNHRGRGIGLATWQAALPRLDGIPTGLDGVVEQQHNYRKSGFAFAHNNLRYQGIVAATATADPAVRPVAPADLDAVIAFDRGCFPAPRDAFLRTWLTPSATRHAMLIEEVGAIAGYGVVRQCGTGWKIGPLFAGDPDGAAALFAALAARAAPGPVILDVPAPNEAALRLVKRHGMQPVFQTARMYRGKPPDLPLERIFGITTFELG